MFMYIYSAFLKEHVRLRSSGMEVEPMKLEGPGAETKFSVQTSLYLLRCIVYMITCPQEIN